MRNAVLLLLCCFALAPALLAEEADLAVIAASLDKSTVVTGERFALTSRLRNDGPDTAREVIISFGSNLGLFPISVTGPAGWTCSRTMSVPNSASCTATSLASGATAEFQAVMLAPQNTAAGPATAHATAWANVPDTRSSNNTRMVPFTLNATMNEAELSVTVDPRDIPATPGEFTNVDVTVKNAGPSAASNVYVAIDSASPAPQVALVGVAADWVCSPTGTTATLCRTAGIAAGATSSFVVRFRTPPQESHVTIYARVQAEMNRDVIAANDFTFGNVQVGSAANWRRALLPVVAEDIAGANGSLWRTEITMLARSSFDIKPHPCDSVITLCPGTPLNRPYDGRFHVTTSAERGGQFVYFPATVEEKIHLNARVYDVSKLTETAGAEIPIPRDDEFTSGTIALLNIPVAPQFRHTLRVYDLDGSASARVLIHVYSGDEATPRTTVVRTLERSPNFERITPALLPSHPSYLQLDPAALLSLTGLQSMRIEIEPVDPGTRFWAFVSITNNDTHHVTTVTPQ